MNIWRVISKKSLNFCCKYSHSSFRNKQLPRSHKTRKSKQSRREKIAEAQSIRTVYNKKTNRNIYKIIYFFPKSANIRIKNCSKLTFFKKTHTSICGHSNSKQNPYQASSTNKSDFSVCAKRPRPDIILRLSCSRSARCSCFSRCIRRISSKLTWNRKKWLDGVGEKFWELKKSRWHF